MKKNIEPLIPAMQMEIEELENKIEEQALKNQKVTKKCLIVIASMFFVVMAAVAVLTFYNISTNNKKIEEYRVETEKQIGEYEQFLNSINE